MPDERHPIAQEHPQEAPDVLVHFAVIESLESPLDVALGLIEVVLGRNREWSMART